MRALGDVRVRAGFPPSPDGGVIADYLGAVGDPAELAARLAATPGVVDWRQGWIWLKLLLVLGLGVFHMRLTHWQREFAADRTPHSSRFFRMVNELPTLALIAIVVLVVVKPF